MNPIPDTRSTPCSTLFSLAVLCLGLQGCASVINGTEQTVMIDTAPVHRAKCDLTNDKGQWRVVYTPGTAIVSRSREAIKVRCKTDSGFDGSTMVQSGTSNAALGNLIVGGVIGAAADMASGAAYQYPASIVVAMIQSPDAPAKAPNQPPQPSDTPVPPAPPTAMAGAPNAGRETTATGRLCYLPDGSELPLDRDACAARKGFIGA